MKKLSKIEINILNRIQKDWHISRTPFTDLSDELGLEEIELISVINDLKNELVIRDISAIFNAEHLGYKSALIAFKVRDTDAAALIINSHPGVSHNYLRDNEFNIWFTLSLKNDESIENEAESMAIECKADDVLVFYNEKMIKIGLMLRIGKDDNTELNVCEDIKQIKYRDLTEKEKKAVFILQNDLPLVNRPFRELAQRFTIGIDENDLVNSVNQFKKEKIIRRYSAIIKHNKAGYSFNAMTVWKIKDDDSISKFKDIQNISHLYLRTVYPGKWEYGLFAMIHGRSEEELNGIIKKLEIDSGTKDYLVLHSLREFKKNRVKYFTNMFI